MSLFSARIWWQATVPAPQSVLTLSEQDHKLSLPSHGCRHLAIIPVPTTTNTRGGSPMPVATAEDAARSSTIFASSKSSKSQLATSHHHDLQMSDLIIIGSYSGYLHCFRPMGGENYDVTQHCLLERDFREPILQVERVEYIQIPSSRYQLAVLTPTRLLVCQVLVVMEQAQQTTMPKQPPSPAATATDSASLIPDDQPPLSAPAATSSLTTTTASAMQVELKPLYQLNISELHRPLLSFYELQIGRFSSLSGTQGVCINTLQGHYLFIEQVERNILLVDGNTSSTATAETNSNDSTFSYPSPFAFSPTCEYLIIFRNDWCLVSYSMSALVSNSFQPFDEQRIMQLYGKNKTARWPRPTWTYPVSERILFIKSYNFNKAPPGIFALGERHLFTLTENGLLRFVKRFDYSPLLCLPYAAVRDNNVMFFITTENSSMLVYENAMLKWSARIPTAAQVCAAGLARVSGVANTLVFLSNDGRLRCCFLGTDITENIGVVSVGTALASSTKNGKFQWTEDTITDSEHAESKRQLCKAGEPAFLRKLQHSHKKPKLSLAKENSNKQPKTKSVIPQFIRRPRSFRATLGEFDPNLIYQLTVAPCAIHFTFRQPFERVKLCFDSLEYSDVRVDPRTVVLFPKDEAARGGGGGEQHQVLINLKRSGSNEPLVHCSSLSLRVSAIIVHAETHSGEDQRITVESDVVQLPVNTAAASSDELAKSHSAEQLPKTDGSVSLVLVYGDSFSNIVSWVNENNKTESHQSASDSVAVYDLHFANNETGKIVTNRARRQCQLVASSTSTLCLLLQHLLAGEQKDRLFMPLENILPPVPVAAVVAPQIIGRRSKSNPSAAAVMSALQNFVSIFAQLLVRRDELNTSYASKRQQLEVTNSTLFASEKRLINLLREKTLSRLDNCQRLVNYTLNYGFNVLQELEQLEQELTLVQGQLVACAFNIAFCVYWRARCALELNDDASRCYGLIQSLLRTPPALYDSAGEFSKLVMDVAHLISKELGGIVAAGARAPGSVVGAFRTAANNNLSMQIYLRLKLLTEAV